VTATGSPAPCVVLGCGRSGTSLLGGTLATAGYDLGAGLLRPNSANPRGYFESRPVNLLNEALLAPVVDAAPAPPHADRPLRDGERWLAVLPPDVDVPARPELADLMAGAVATPDGLPLARKDPRFTWTLPAWPEPIASAVRIVVVRHPLAAARSILGMTDKGDLGLRVEGALAHWSAVYRRVLHLCGRDGQRWVFVHWSQLLDGSAATRLADALHLPALPPSFVDATLDRSSGAGELPDDVADLHDQLVALTAR
jgi:hypothetical protein